MKVKFSGKYLRSKRDKWNCNESASDSEDLEDTTNLFYRTKVITFIYPRQYRYFTVTTTCKFHTRCGFTFLIQARDYDYPCVSGDLIHTNASYLITESTDIELLELERITKFVKKALNHGGKVLILDNSPNSDFATAVINVIDGSNLTNNSLSAKLSRYLAVAPRFRSNKLISNVFQFQLPNN